MGNRLQGKIALVTGAASGIGRAIAYRFATEGAKIAVVDIINVGSRETVENILAEGGSAVFVEADLSNPEQVHYAVETVVVQWQWLVFSDN